MTDQESSEGGPANRPPLRGPADHEPPASQPAGDEPAGVEPSARTDPTPAAAGEPTGAVGDTPPAAEHPLDALDPEPDVPPDISAPDDPAERRHFGRRTGDEVRRRAERQIHRRFEHVADSLDDAAERISRFAADQVDGPGARARAGVAAQSTAGWMEDVAEYLRSSDLRRLREDLEHQVRDKPVQTLLIAATAGWLIGRIMR